MHWLWPNWSLNVPGAQAVHTRSVAGPGMVAEVPAAQSRHASHSNAFDVSLKWLASQGSQRRSLVADGNTSTYWPAGQVTQLAQRVAFGVVLFSWLALNSGILPALGIKPFDQYPFIFLNLILSMLAAIQAPIIMMSQNRQAAKDRIAARHDYEVNLRAQLELTQLSHKLDKVLRHLAAIDTRLDDRLPD